MEVRRVKVLGDMRVETKGRQGEREKEKKGEISIHWN